jgi:hypothetical protein
MDNFNTYADLLLCPLLASSLVTGVHPQMREARKVILYTLQQQSHPVLIGDFGAVHPGLQHQPFRIHQQVSLPAADFLTTVVASLLPAHTARLVRLGIDYRSAGMKVSS